MKLLTFSKFKTRRAIPAVFWASLLFLWGCTPGETRVEEGNRLGILHMGYGSDASSLDPHVATDDSSAQINWSLHEGLVVSNPYNLELEPGVAESWEISEDGKIYRFKIRSDAKWSDGQPLTIDDVYWSFRRHLTPALGNPWSFMLFPVINAEAYVKGEITDFDQVGFKVVDDATFEIHLKNPTPYFLQLLAHSSSSIVNRKAIEAQGSATSRFSQWTRAGNLKGNGPFYLEHWDINQPIVVKKNPHYWDAERVSLNEIHFYPVDDQATEERMFRAGLLHKTNTIPTDKFPGYKQNNPEVLRSFPYLATYYYQVNVTREPFTDVRVRKALAMSIDRQAIIDNVLNSMPSPAFAMVPPGTIGYQPPKTFDYDPDEARKLLADAGYPNGEGINGFELMYNTSEGHRRIAVAIQQMWKKELNIDVTLANQEWKVFLNTVDNQQFDVARAGWIGDYVDPMTFLDLGTSSNGSNGSGFSDPEYDQMIFEYVPSARSHEERLQRFFEAETYLMERMPFIPIYTYVSTSLLDPSVKNMPGNLRKFINYRYVRLEAN